MKEEINKINFGIIGIGNHALKVINTFKNSSHCHLQALGTSAEQKVLQLKNKFPELEIHSSYDDLIKSKNIQAVYICTANHLHYTLAKKSLEADKHVLCEKPLCLKQTEAEELAKIAKKTSKVMAEGFMYRFHPQNQHVRNLLATGTIGEPRLLNAYYHYQLNDNKNIRQMKECRGGALTDAGCYLIDLCIFLFGKVPNKISATSNFNQQLGVDLSTQVQLNFPNYLQANLSASMEMPRKNSYTIFGTEGHIKVRNAFHVEPKQTTYIEVQSNNGKISTLSVEPFDQLRAQLDNFSLQIQNSTDQQSTFNDYTANAKIMEEVIRLIDK